MRIFQAARDLGVASKDLVDMLRAAGVDAKSAASTIDDATFQLAEQLVSGGGGTAVAEAPEPRGRAVAEPAGPIPAPRAGKPSTIPVVRTSPRKELGVTEVEAAPPEPVADAGASPRVDVAANGDRASAEPERAEPELVEASPSAAVDESAHAAASGPSQLQPSISPSRHRLMAPIPPPSSSRPGAIPSGRATTGPGSAARRPRDDRRGSVLPPGLATSPPGGVRKPVVQPRKPDPRAQQPVTRLTPDGVRGAAPPAVGAGAASVGRKPIDVDDETADRKKKKKLGAGVEGDRRRRGRDSRGGFDDDEDGGRIRRHKPRPKPHQVTAASGPTVIDAPITVRSFSKAAGIPAPQLIKKLVDMGVLARMNDALSEEQAQLLALDLGIEIQIKRAPTAESRMEEQILLAEQDTPESLKPRPPVVTFMGHVDHGKTSLMDRIRSANVVASEAGGITQHIGAYQVDTPTGPVTFLDTPGHQAFTAMRARGANVTDFVVLVVAADDGVMPQTEEAIHHAQAAGVPIVVAINKSDLPGANPDRVMQQMSRFNLVPEAWGGETIVVPTSAVTGAGIDKLLESLTLVAELKELKANPDRASTGTCIEASLDPDMGVRATVLVRAGTLRRGDVVICGASFGRVRAIVDHRGQPLEVAGPSTPVVVAGLDEVPDAGQTFVVVPDVSKAREIAEQRKSRFREQTRAPDQVRTLETLFEKKLDDLNLIVKADVRGSLEALRKEIGSFTHDEVRVKIIHDGIGGISESDVLLAHASKAIIVGFHTVPDDGAAALAAEKGVEIRRYEIIYQVIDDIKKALEGLLKPDTKEVQLGRAIVQQVYPISRVGTVAGCRVLNGTIERNSKLRVIRDGVVIGAYPIESLRRVKDDVKEVRQDLECGIKLAGFNDVKRGDLLESFRIEEIKRTL